MAALDYAAHGFAVFPCLERSKAPACSRGFKSATTNPATIRRWWSGYHIYNIAFATGLVSGVWVLDVDGGAGAAALHDLELKYGALPSTLCSITAEGCHLWFRVDAPIPSSTGRIALGLDVRADGGYVLVPPSQHPDGPTYRWSNSRPIATAPDWLVRLTWHKPRAPAPLPLQPRRSSAARGGYGMAALERECAALAAALPGTRNHALNRAAFRLHQLVAGGEINADEVVRALTDAATANGLINDDGPRSVAKTIESGARAGLQQPRTRRKDR